MKYDVILFDNASETDEMCSTLPLLFSPSALIMFGDRFRKPKDSLRLNQKYIDYNLNQSMFQRLFDAGHCVLNLKYTGRFSVPVLAFLNHCFYEQSLQSIGQPSNANAQMAGFGVFHRRTDSFMFGLLRLLMQAMPPKDYKYGIILPPNISTRDLDETLA